jgi:hypothetical protein
LWGGGKQVGHYGTGFGLQISSEDLFYKRIPKQGGGSNFWHADILGFKNFLEEQPGCLLLAA